MHKFLSILRGTGVLTWQHDEAYGIRTIFAEIWYPLYMIKLGHVMNTGFMSVEQEIATAVTVESWETV